MNEQRQKQALYVILCDARSLMTRISKRKDDYISIFAMKRTREHFEHIFRSKFDITASVVDGRVRIEHDEAGECVAKLFQAFPDRIQSITLAKPTLEDVFIQKTGLRFWEDREVVA